MRNTLEELRSFSLNDETYPIELHKKQYELQEEEFMQLKGKLRKRHIF